MISARSICCQALETLVDRSIGGLVLQFTLYVIQPGGEAAPGVWRNVIAFAVGCEYPGAEVLAKFFVGHLFQVDAHYRETGVQRLGLPKLRKSRDEHASG